MARLMMATALAVLLYLAVAETAFQFRNPKANDAASYLHFWSALSFKRLPQFQE